MCVHAYTYVCDTHTREETVCDMASSRAHTHTHARYCSHIHKCICNYDTHTYACVQKRLFDPPSHDKIDRLRRRVDKLERRCENVHTHMFTYMYVLYVLVSVHVSGYASLYIFAHIHMYMHAYACLNVYVHEYIQSQKKGIRTHVLA